MDDSCQNVRYEITLSIVALAEDASDRLVREVVLITPVDPEHRALAG